MEKVEAVLSVFFLSGRYFSGGGRLTHRVPLLGLSRPSGLSLGSRTGR